MRLLVEAIMFSPLTPDIVIPIEQRGITELMQIELPILLESVPAGNNSASYLLQLDEFTLETHDDGTPLPSIHLLADQSHEQRSNVNTLFGVTAAVWDTKITGVDGIALPSFMEHYNVDIVIVING